MVADTLPVQMDLMKEGLSLGQVGQRPFEMGYKTMYFLLDIVKDGKNPEDPTYTGLDVCTPDTATPASAASQSAEHDNGAAPGGGGRSNAFRGNSTIGQRSHYRITHPGHRYKSDACAGWRLIQPTVRWRARATKLPQRPCGRSSAACRRLGVCVWKRDMLELDLQEKVALITGGRRRAPRRGRKARRRGCPRRHLCRGPHLEAAAASCGRKPARRCSRWPRT